MAMLKNSKHELFCSEFLVDLNATKAYMRAYTSCRSERAASASASKLLTSANITARVQELKKERADRLNITVDEVVKDLIEVKDRCMQATPVKVWDSEAHAYIDSDAEFTFDSKGANRSLELLGNHLGMFKTKLDVNVDGGVVINNDIPKRNKSD